ncbi:MAG: AAA family ATPase [Enterococcus faecium]|nr:AAA family ATPase [Enterococcus faecium]
MEIIKATDIDRASSFSVLIYAPPGGGKTYTANYLKGKTLVIDIDRTTNVLAGNPNIDIVYADLNDVEVGMKKMLKDIHDNYLDQYDNIFFDNLSEFEQAWLAEKSRLSKTRDGKAMGIPEMGDYNKFSFYLPDMIRYINSWKGVNKVFTAWETQIQIQSPGGQIFNQFHPQIREKIVNNVMGLMNMVGRLMMNEETGQRGFLLKRTDQTFAKNQLDDREFALQEELFNIDGTVRLSE